MQKCPHCGTEAADEVVHCGNCGKSLKAPVAPAAAAGPVPKKTMMGMVAVQGAELDKAIAAAKSAVAAQQAAKAAGKPAPVPAAPRKASATMMGFAAVQAPEVKVPAAPKPTATDDGWGAAAADDAEDWTADPPPKPAAPGAKPIGMGTAAIPAKPSTPAKTVMFESAPTPAPAPAVAAKPAAPAKTVMFESAPTASPAPAAASPAPAAAPSAPRPPQLGRTMVFDAAPTTPAPPAAAASATTSAVAPKKDVSALAKTMMFDSAPTDAPAAVAEKPRASALPPQLARTAIMDAIDDSTADKLLGKVPAEEAPRPRTSTGSVKSPPALAATLVSSPDLLASDAPEVPRTPAPALPTVSGEKSRPRAMTPAPGAVAGEKSRPRAPTPAPGTVQVAGEPGKRLVRTACTAIGALLLLLFFVPLGDGAMAWDALSAASGAGKLFAVWMPLAAVILLIAGLAPMGYPLRAGIATVVGLVPLVGAGAGHGLPAATSGVRGVLTMVGVVVLSAGCLLRARFHGSTLARGVVAVAGLGVVGLLFAPSEGHVALLAGFRTGGGALVVSVGLALLLTLAILSFLAFMKGETTGGCGLWGHGLLAWLPLMALLAGFSADEVQSLPTIVGTIATAGYAFAACYGLYQVLASMSAPTP